MGRAEGQRCGLDQAFAPQPTRVLVNSVWNVATPFIISICVCSDTAAELTSGPDKVKWRKRGTARERAPWRVSCPGQRGDTLWGLPLAEPPGSGHPADSHPGQLWFCWVPRPGGATLNLFTPWVDLTGFFALGAGRL